MNKEGTAASFLRYIKSRFLRNNKMINGEKVLKNKVNLEWWGCTENLGDYLSNVVFEWMLQRRNIDNISSKTLHLLGIGSIIGLGKFDAIIWGSGIHAFESIENINYRKKFVKYDIRALRGPVTKLLMEKMGYDCSKARLGDPAILMPEIYFPSIESKQYEISIISHILLENKDYGDLHKINIRTTDYKFFIDEILKSKKIISSSLHGIILAESYGVPAVFFGTGMELQYLKYYDWYFSTGRYSVKIARTLEEAVEMEPMQLPDLCELRKGLLESFPYDLFKA